MSNNLWNQDNYDPKRVREVEVCWWSSRPAIIAVAAVVVVLIGLIVYYAFQDSNSSGSGTEVPVIEAGETPVRERPENPGGYTAPDQDKQIYETITSGGKEAKAEQLLAAPEEPLPAPTIVMDSVEEEGAPSENVGGSKSSAIDPQQVTIQEKDVEGIIPKAKSKGSVKSGKKETAAKSGHKAQLASLKSEAAAKKEWKLLQKRYAKELKGLKMSIEKISLGKKGTYHRLYVGPFKTKADTKSFCKRLTAKGGHCLV